MEEVKLRCQAQTLEGTIMGKTKTRAPQTPTYGTNKARRVVSRAKTD